MKSILTFIFLLCANFLTAQPIVNPTAITTPLTLTFPLSAANSSSVVFNPNLNLYYTCRNGNTTFPLLTFNAAGVLLNNDVVGLDTRGLWWNPNNNQLERNCFSSTGWGQINLNGLGYAINTNSVFFSGQLQPSPQSIGAYDYNTNTVLFNNNGVIHLYNRATGLSIGATLLSGTNLANLNVNSVIYTGVAGKEWGLFNHIDKKIILFNEATGIASDSSLLPITFPVFSTFRFSYTNNLVWIYDVSTNTWNSYNIWNTALPLQLITFIGNLENEKVKLSWETSMEENVKGFQVLKSSDLKTFYKIGWLNAINSLSRNSYEYIDNSAISGNVFYKLLIEDLDGKTKESNIVKNFTRNNSEVSIFPNPCINQLTINSSINDKVKIINTLGQVQQAFQITKGTNEIDISKLNIGVYFLQFQNSKTIQFSKL